METRDCIRARRSIRKYLDVPVEWDKVVEILECGRSAPSAGNLQDFFFIVVTDKTRREEIADACMQQVWMTQAPVHIVVCADVKKNSQFYGDRGEKLYTIQDSAVVVENMLLAATDLGLGSCFVSAMKDDHIQKILGIIDDVIPQAVVTIGYPDEKVSEPARFELRNLTYIERFRSTIRDADATLGYHSAKVQRAVRKGKSALQKVREKIGNIGKK